MSEVNGSWIIGVKKHQISNTVSNTGSWLQTADSIILQYQMAVSFLEFQLTKFPTIQCWQISVLFDWIRSEPARRRRQSTLLWWVVLPNNIYLRYPVDPPNYVLRHFSLKLWVIIKHLILWFPSRCSTTGPPNPIGMFHIQYHYCIFREILPDISSIERPKSGTEFIR
jgi:hypothetical protein